MDFLANTPQGFTTEAVCCRRGGDGTIVRLTAQSFTFSAPGNVSSSAGGDRSRYDLRRRFLSPFSFRVLAIGQLLTSGPYATDRLQLLSPAEQAGLLTAVGRALSSDGQGYQAILIKDACHPASETHEALVRDGYFSLPVDPVMELTIKPGWVSLEDYLAALTSKYRVRYRRARTKMEGVTRRLLTPAEVRAHSRTLYGLYQSTSSGAAYNAATLTEEYFPWLATLRDAGNVAGLSQREGLTYVTGYYDAGNLVGFTTAIRNGPVLHAHYLGLTETYKRSHHLYHNMLFDLLGRAIECGVSKLDYGRTALEIKSSVGARATTYSCLLKAGNPLLNRLIPLFTPAVYTAPDWTPRNPFK